MCFLFSIKKIVNKLTGQTLFQKAVGPYLSWFMPIYLTRFFFFQSSVYQIYIDTDNLLVLLIPVHNCFAVDVYVPDGWR